MLDPFSTGPLSCGGGMRQGTAGDASTIASLRSAHDNARSQSHSHAAGKKAKTNNAIFSFLDDDESDVFDNLENFDDTLTMQDRIKARIQDFSKRGWISQKEEQKYTSILRNSGTPRGPIKNTAVANHVLKELSQELDATEEKCNGGTMINKQTRIIKAAANEIMSHATNLVLGERRSSSADPKSSKSLSSQTLKPKAAPQSFPKVKQQPINPEDLRNMPPPPPPPGPPPSRKSKLPAITDPKSLKDDLSTEETEELFIQMCFFAKQGFIQPPCCLACTYNEAMNGAAPNTACSRWVVWRKDAKKQLRPGNLEDNLLVVRCSESRKLIEGRVATRGYRWDRISKRLQQ